MTKTIIDNKKYEYLSKIVSGGKDDLELVINIIEKCDIQQSFVNILLLISCTYDNYYSMSTPLMKSPNLYNYIEGLLLDHKESKNVYSGVPITYDLTLLLELYEKNCLKLGIEPDTLIKKHIIRHYNYDVKGLHISSIKNQHLKPRKNVKRNHT